MYEISYFYRVITVYILVCAQIAGNTILVLYIICISQYIFTPIPLLNIKPYIRKLWSLTLLNYLILLFLIIFSLFSQSSSLLLLR